MRIDPSLPKGIVSSPIRRKEEDEAEEAEEAGFAFVEGGI